MDLDLNCVESFVALANERHYGHAATRLHMTASALSKRIERLETCVGARLVERDTGGFRGLTKAGVQFLNASDDLLRAARSARYAALHANDVPVVYLGVPGSPTDHLPLAKWRLVQLAFRQHFPTARIELRSVAYGSVEESILSGWVDVLISTACTEHLDLEYIQLGVSARVLLIPRKHELSGASTLSTTDIADVCLVREPTAAPYWMAPWLLGDLRGAVDIRTVDVHVRNIADIEHAVALDKAAAILSDFTPISHPDLLTVPIANAPLMPFYCVKKRTDERELVAVLVDTLRIMTISYVYPAVGVITPVVRAWP